MSVASVFGRQFLRLPRASVLGTNRHAGAPRQRARREPVEEPPMILDVDLTSPVPPLSNWVTGSWRR